MGLDNYIYKIPKKLFITEQKQALTVHAQKVKNFLEYWNQTYYPSEGHFSKLSNKDKYNFCLWDDHLRYLIEDINNMALENINIDYHSKDILTFILYHILEKYNDPREWELWYGRKNYNLDTAFDELGFTTPAKWSSEGHYIEGIHTRILSPNDIIRVAKLYPSLQEYYCYNELINQDKDYVYIWVRSA